ncbi:MAG: tetratricopeptide repeat protein [Thermodesulfobacteriota bacterium]
MVSPQQKTLSEYFQDHGLLLVEDRPTMRRTLRTMFKTFGVPPENIYEAGDGPDALEILKHETKSFFVLLDLNLPSMTGLEVLEKINADPQLKDTPVVVVTADNHEGSVAIAVEAGAKGYIIKPFTEKTLKEKISNVINPPDFLETFNRIEQHLEEGEYDKAIKLADLIIEIKPGSPGAYLLRGEGYEGLKRDDEALASYEAAHKFAPIYMRVLKKLTDFFLRRDRLEEALVYLEKADKLSPFNPERKINLGRLYLETGRMAKVKKVFDEAVKLNPALVDQAAETCLEKRPDLAEYYYRASLAIKQDITTINQLGIALRNQGKWAEAIKEYELALRISPSDEGLYFNLGRAYAEGGQIQAAVRSFKKALDLNPRLKPARKEYERMMNILQGQPEPAPGQ